MNKTIKKISNLYLKKFIYNVIYFLDDLLATLANYCKSYFSKEEQNRLLALLIEDLNQYKESLEATSIENSQESSGL